MFDIVKYCEAIFDNGLIGEYCEAIFDNGLIGEYCEATWQWFIDIEIFTIDKILIMC